MDEVDALTPTPAPGLGAQCLHGGALLALPPAGLSESASHRFEHQDLGSDT